jgi:hypothetical protein
VTNFVIISVASVDLLMLLSPIFSQHVHTRVGSGAGVVTSETVCPVPVQSTERTDLQCAEGRLLESCHMQSNVWLTEKKGRGRRRGSKSGGRLDTTSGEGEQFSVGAV